VPFLGLLLGAIGCFDSLPPFAGADFDGDGISEEEGDCNDGDPAVFPGADECSVLLPEPTDHDCDEHVDGGQLPWSDEFDDGVLSGWVQGGSSLAVLEEADGLLIQAMPKNLTLFRARGAECWSDLDVTARFFVGMAGEFACSIFLRTGLVEEEGAGYEFSLHHHSTSMDGVNGHWDGWQIPSLKRIDVEGDGEYLVGDNVERTVFYPQDYLPASSSYVVHITATEVEGATELICEYDMEDGTGFHSCFPGHPGVVLDDHDLRPLAGGVGLACSEHCFNYLNIGQDHQNPDGQLGVAVDYVRIAEAER